MSQSTLHNMHTALLPGAGWVPSNAPMQTRIDWDLWVMGVVLAPSALVLWLLIEALLGKW